MLVAEHGGSTMVARIGLMQAHGPADALAGSRGS
jgi:hypothetical protein